MTGDRPRRNPMGLRELAELRLVRDRHASGPTTATRGTHLRNPTANQLNGRELTQVADHEKG